MTRHMRSERFRVVLLWVIVVAMVGGSTVSMSAAPLVLGAKAFYRMVAKPLANAAAFEFPNPLADVSLNPCPLPPGGLGASTALDLSNPGSPLYTQPNVGEDFTEINWGMNLGFAGVHFSLPSLELGDRLDDPSFSVFLQGTDQQGARVGDRFRLDFQIEGPVGGETGDLVSLNPCPLPPGSPFSEAPFGGDASMQGAFNLRFRFPSQSAGNQSLRLQQSAGGPSLGFQLFNVTTGQQFGFSAVPEPSTLMLAGCGVAAALVRRRLRTR